MVSLGFTGEFLDDATSAYPLGIGYRWHLPWLMRFNAPDDASPFGLGDANPYCYCAADPINDTDPSGHMPLRALGLKLDLSLARRNIALGAGEAARDASAAEEAAYRPVFGPPTRQELRAANTIKRGWRKFVHTRNHDLDEILDTLPPMAEKLSSGDSAVAALKEGQIVVQANGEPGKALSGHSAIRYRGMRHEVLVFNKEMAAQSKAAARFGLSEEAAQFYSQYSPGSRATISSDLPDAEDLAKMNHLAGKGRLFALKPEFSEYFPGVLQAEIEDFKRGEYSYGLHYNCHRFVLNILRRLRASAG